MPNATRSFNSHPDLLKNGNNGRPLYEAERKRTRDQKYKFGDQHQLTATNPGVYGLLMSGTRDPHTLTREKSQLPECGGQKGSASQAADRGQLRSVNNPGGPLALSLRGCPRSGKPKMDARQPAVPGLRCALPQRCRPEARQPGSREAPSGRGYPARGLWRGAPRPCPVTWRPRLLLPV